MDRRRLLAATVATFAAPVGALLSPAARAAGLRPLGRPEPFDYAALKGQARKRAGAAYKAPVDALPADLAGLDYDRYQAIRFRSDHALWGDAGLHFRAQFFHRGLFFKKPVQMFEVSGGQAQELAFDPAMFDYGTSGVVAAAQPPDLGFAGFRLNFHTALDHDIAAFLGASYFRAVGAERQYGLSARGLAIDTGSPAPEEFPDFTAFYFERPDAAADTVVVYALLDSPSVAGAYRFAITPADVLAMEVDAALYPRRAIERLGVAPCTSMFQTGENDRRMGHDWRPELHDSDGLAMATGAGEWIWRPLTNPASLAFNAFVDSNPRGFGLLQRDRDFDHYQDDGVFYDRRPSLWVEPKGDWGAGSVQLVEIPTVDETFDNIVAFWSPADKPQPGAELLLGWRLWWGTDTPQRPPLARCMATRTGLGGVVGQKRPYFTWRFAVDFAGPELAQLDPQTKVEPVISASRGQVELASARPLAALKGWRAIFDLKPDDGTDPVTLRLYLARDGQALSETWLYQWAPPPLDERKVF